MVIKKQFQTDDNEPKLVVDFEFSYAPDGTLDQVLATFSLKEARTFPAPVSAVSPASPVSPPGPSASVAISLKGETIVHLTLSSGKVSGSCHLQSLSDANGGIYMDVFYGNATNIDENERFEGIAVLFEWHIPSA